MVETQNRSDTTPHDPSREPHTNTAPSPPQQAAENNHHDDEPPFLDPTGYDLPEVPHAAECATTFYPLTHGASSSSPTQTPPAPTKSWRGTAGTFASMADSIRPLIVSAPQLPYTGGGMLPAEGDKLLCNLTAQCWIF